MKKITSSYSAISIRGLTSFDDFIGASLLSIFSHDQEYIIPVCVILAIVLDLMGWVFHKTTHNLISQISETKYLLKS